MSIDLQIKIVDAGTLFFAFGFPVMLFCSFRRRWGTKYVALIFCGTVLVAWIIQFFYRCWTFPIRYEYITAHADPDAEDYGMYDGVGGNVVILLFGWISPLGALAAFLILERLIKVLKRLLLHTAPPKPGA